ncbi:hypothetical protein FGO68_gene9099 [Halteria grandinella]|uniref:Uncharacterized protein n=1 Tax=Halteria grandinella TaxID=5974 RepID=A0A8J8NVQ6_HALGN|nr:hypothetical protein FGO68_gene9099 [Halteria grandinella]
MVEPLAPNPNAIPGSVTVTHPEHKDIPNQKVTLGLNLTVTQILKNYFFESQPKVYFLFEIDKKMNDNALNQVLSILEQTLTQYVNERFLQDRVFVIPFYDDKETPNRIGLINSNVPYFMELVRENSNVRLQSLSRTYEKIKETLIECAKKMTPNYKKTMKFVLIKGGQPYEVGYQDLEKTMLNQRKEHLDISFETIFLTNGWDIYQKAPEQLWNTQDQDFQNQVQSYISKAFSLIKLPMKIKFPRQMGEPKQLLLTADAVRLQTISDEGIIIDTQGYSLAQFFQPGICQPKIIEFPEAKLSLNYTFQQVSKDLFEQHREQIQLFDSFKKPVAQPIIQQIPKPSQPQPISQAPILLGTPVGEDDFAQEQVAILKENLRKLKLYSTPAELSKAKADCEQQLELFLDIFPDKQELIDEIMEMGQAIQDLMNGKTKAQPLLINPQMNIPRSIPIQQQQPQLPIAQPSMAQPSSIHLPPQQIASTLQIGNTPCQVKSNQLSEAFTLSESYYQRNGGVIQNLETVRSQLPNKIILGHKLDQVQLYNRLKELTYKFQINLITFSDLYIPYAIGALIKFEEDHRPIIIRVKPYIDNYTDPKTGVSRMGLAVVFTVTFKDHPQIDLYHLLKLKH